MKKLVSIVFLIIMLFSPNFISADTCPTGYSSVKTSWWNPINDTWFTMCGCQAVLGYEASGSCGGSGGSNQQF